MFIQWLGNCGGYKAWQQPHSHIGWRFERLREREARQVQFFCQAATQQLNYKIQNNYLINKTLHHAPELLNGSYLMEFPKVDERNSCHFRKRDMVAPLRKVNRKQFNG